MTLPAIVSIVTAVIGAVFALLALGFSSAPGWQELRWFSLSAALAAGYATCNSIVTLPVTGASLEVASRFSLFFGGMHGAAWFFYLGALDRRRLNALERVILGLGCALGTLALVPHLLVSSALSSHQVTWLGVTYRDVLPTPLGELCYLVYCAALVVLLGQSVRRLRRGAPDARAHVFGLAGLLLAGVNDSLAASRVLDTPYLLDIGFLAVAGGVGAAITSRFLRGARSLEEYSVRLRTTQAVLVKRERLAALGELSAVIAHEVRNPVAVIFNALSSIKRLPAESSETKALFGIVQEEAERLKRMVADLLAFARPHDLNVTPASLPTLLAGAVDAARGAAGDGVVDVSVEVAPDVPTVTCDEQLMRQAVINLVANAIHASSRREPVRVRAELEHGPDQAVRIEVTDDGEGVPREFVDHIFTPFFTTRATGTGLGLAVVRSIAEAHGGDAALAAAGGPGATFVIRVPVDARRR